MRVDLNADLGEGFGIWTLGDDAGLLRIVTSANVACGFHAGDPSIIAAVCRDAAARGVAVGAQVSYRDLHGFGRRRMEVSPEELIADVVYQIGAVRALARMHGTDVTYVKPHGALYNVAAIDPAVATAVAVAVAAVDGTLPVLCQPGSALARAAQAAGLAAAAEGFADRAYLPDGRLAPRSEPGAVLHDAALIVRRSLQMALEGRVEAVDGTVIAMPVQSICVHGDTPGAVGIAAAVRAALTEHGAQLGAFAPPPAGG